MKQPIGLGSLRLGEIGHVRQVGLVGQVRQIRQSVADQKLPGWWAFSIGLLFALTPVRAEEQSTYFSGNIVSIRGNIIQYHPSLGAPLARVVIGPETSIASTKAVKLEDLTVGMRIMAWGEGTPNKDFKPGWIQVSKEATGEFAQKFHAFVPNDYGSNGKFGGTLTSVHPFVVTNDDGETVTGEPTKDAQFWDNKRGDRKSLLVGMSISGDAVTAPDGVAHAKTIQFNLRAGKAGAVFGTVRAVHGNTVEMTPRFTTDTQTVTVAPGAKLQKQAARDLDSIAVGDRVSIWGHHPESWTSKTDIIAYVVLAGNADYPRANQASGDAADQTRTGVVTAMHPFTLKQDDGKPLTVTVPGQTPYSDLRPMRLSELKPGDQVMVIGAMDDKDVMKATDVVRDAPPVVGLGD